MTHVLLPSGWASPRGHANGMAVRARHVYVAGMIGWGGQGRFHTDDLAGQVRQALASVVAVLAEAGAKPEHIARMTWYVTDKREYLAAARDIGAAISRADRRLRYRDDGGAGERAARGPGQGRDRCHRGRAGLSLQSGVFAGAAYH